MEEKRLGNLYGFDGGNYAGNVYSTNGVAPTIRTFQGGNQQPMIIKAAKVLGGLGEKKSNRGTQYYQQDRVYSSDGLAVCLSANLPGGSNNYMIKVRVANKQGFTLLKEGGGGRPKLSKQSDETRESSEYG